MSWRLDRTGPLAHLDARQRKKFHEDLGFSYPLLILGGLDLAAGIVVLAATPYFEQGLVATVSGGLAVAGGLSMMIHTLVDWGIGPARTDRWSMRQPPVQVAVGFGTVSLRW